MGIDRRGGSPADGPAGRSRIRGAVDGAATDTVCERLSQEPSRQGARRSPVERVPRASPAPPAFCFSERRHPDGREAVPRRGSDLRFPND